MSLIFFIVQEIHVFLFIVITMCNVSSLIHYILTWSPWPFLLLLLIKIARMWNTKKKTTINFCKTHEHVRGVLGPTEEITHASSVEQQRTSSIYHITYRTVAIWSSDSHFNWWSPNVCHMWNSCNYLIDFWDFFSFQFLSNFI